MYNQGTIREATDYSYTVNVFTSSAISPVLDTIIGLPGPSKVITQMNRKRKY